MVDFLIQKIGPILKKPTSSFEAGKAVKPEVY